MNSLSLIIFTCLFSIIASAQNAVLFDTGNSNLINNDLWEVSVDKNGNKYLGTVKFGLIKLENENFTILNRENSLIKGDVVTPIFSDSNGNIWLNYDKPKSEIAKYDGKEWTVFTTKEIPASSISVIDFTEDKEGNIYFGGEYGVFKYNGITWSEVEIPNIGITIRAMDINDKGEIAIGHNSGLLIFSNNKWDTYNEENSELQLSVVRAVKFVDNKLFIGYGGGYGNGGLSVFENEKWTHFSKSNSKIPDHMVRDIEVDENGTLWMATNNGLIKMVDNNIEPIYFREGTYTNVILDIAIEGNLVWIATNFGLIKITQQ